MNGAGSGQLFVQKMAHSCTKTLFAKEVLCRGITVEFSSMQDILEKTKDIEDSSRYDIGSQMSVETAHRSTHANQSVARSSK